MTPSNDAPRVLAFRHVPFEDVGLIGPVLEKRGVAIDHADLYRDGAAPPKPDAYAGLIFMGGPMSANDPLPYLEWEMRAIRRALERGQPVAGICLGAQLIAKAMGARVYRNPIKEIGWFDVRFTEWAHDDRIFRGIAPRATVFHWHGETFDLPRGAVLLAESERCRHQAFRAGGGVYGLQFHLEVTPAMIADWCAQDANCGDMRELGAPPDPRLHRAEMAALADVVFSRWCDLLTS